MDWIHGARKWLSSIRALDRALNDREVHAYLTTASFEFDGDEQARVVDPQYIKSQFNRSARTVTSVWKLAAPEQTIFGDGVIDRRTNVYNVGVFGFSVITGFPPYGGVSGEDLSNAIVRDPVGTIDSSPAIWRIVARATHKSRDMRYQSLAALEHELSLAIRGSTRSNHVLVGRGHEMARIESLFDGSSGEKGGVISIVGEAGIGKSHLWEVASDRIVAPEDLYHLQKTPQVSAVPFQTIASTLDRLLSIDYDNANRLVARRSPEFQQALTRIVTFPGRLEMVPPPGGGNQLKHPVPRFVAELARLMHDLMQRDRRSILVYDDVQWMDARTLQTLSEFSRYEMAGRYLVFLGRPEAIPWLDTLERTGSIHLRGLSNDECLQLLDREATTGEMDKPPESPGADYSRVLSMSGGNPLALLTLATAQPTSSFHVTGGNEPRRPIDEVLLDLAVDRLGRLSDDARRLAMAVSLVPNPVRVDLLRQVDLPVFRGDRFDDALAEATSALILESAAATSGGERISITHDTIEAALRRFALIDGAIVRSVSNYLARAAREGSDDALFMLARVIVDLQGQSREERDPLAASDDRSILVRAAIRAIERLAPEMALLYAGTAITRHRSRLSPAVRLRMHEIAHEAAFLSDDTPAMSRHFQSIRALGDSIRVNTARKLWVTRAFADVQHERAIRLGRLVLSELGVQIPADPTHEQHAKEMAALRDYRWRRFQKCVRRLPLNRDARSRLVIDTCVSLLAPIVVARPLLTPFVLRVVLEFVQRHGRTRETGLAFLYWAMLVAKERYDRTAVVRLGRIALELVNLDGSTSERLTAEIATRIFTQHWERDHRETHAELLPLSREALRTGNQEWAAHALHLYCAGAFIVGRPLDTYLLEGKEMFEKVGSLGFTRSQRAIGIYLQAAEAVQGVTVEPFSLTGSFMDEEETIATFRELGDSLGVWGLTAIRAQVSLYNGSIDLAFRDMDKAWHMPANDRSLPEIQMICFIRAMTGWITGNGEAAGQCERIVKRWAKLAPVNHLHRLHLVAAERVRSKGRRIVARKLYERSIERAIRNEHIHEAALAAERLGDMLLEDADAARTAATTSRLEVAAQVALHQAQSLYALWGAARASERVRRRLGWGEPARLINPLIRDREFVERVINSNETDTLLRQTLFELGEIAGETLAFLIGQVSETRLCYRFRPNVSFESRVNRIDEESLPFFVRSAVLERRAAEESHGDAADSSKAGHLFLDSPERNSTWISVVFLESARGVRVDSGVAERARRALMVAWTALQLRHLSFVSQRQQQELILSDRMSSLGMLAATTAHEIGNPNHILQLNLQSLRIALSTGADSSAAVKFVDEIESASRRIQEVVQSTTTFARGGRSREVREVDPREIVSAAYRFTRIYASSFTDEFRLEADSDVPNLFVVPGLIEQALINLVKNACEALNDRRSPVAIGCRHDPDSATVQFFVKDEGRGLPVERASAEGIDRMAFQTEKDAGSGLGLSIVQTIVEMHDGRLSFGSGDGFATIVTIHVPVASE